MVCCAYCGERIDPKYYCCPGCGRELPLDFKNAINVAVNFRKVKH